MQMVLLWKEIHVIIVNSPNALPFYHVCPSMIPIVEEVVIHVPVDHVALLLPMILMLFAVPRKVSIKRTYNTPQKKEVTLFLFFFRSRDSRAHRQNEKSPITQKKTVCTKEAKICPDGSTVGRDPCDDCEFEPCPEIVLPCRPVDKTYCGKGGESCPDGSCCTVAPDDSYAVCCPEEGELLPSTVSYIRTQTNTQLAPMMFLHVVTGLRRLEMVVTGVDLSLAMDLNVLRSILRFVEGDQPMKIVRKVHAVKLLPMILMLFVVMLIVHR